MVYCLAGGEFVKILLLFFLFFFLYMSVVEEMGNREDRDEYIEIGGKYN